MQHAAASVCTLHMAGACRSSRFRPTMAIVRKAKYRFSTLRSRVMHRSASGSQIGDLQRQGSSLSVQLSGQSTSLNFPRSQGLAPALMGMQSCPTALYALAQPLSMSTPHTIRKVDGQSRMHPTEAC